MFSILFMVDVNTLIHGGNRERNRARGQWRRLEWRLRWGCWSYRLLRLQDAIVYDGLTDAYDKIHMVSPAAQKWDTWVCHLQTWVLHELLCIKTVFRWTWWNNVSAVGLTLLVFCLVHGLSFFVAVRHFDHDCVIYPVTEKLSPLNRWLFSLCQFMSGLLLQTKLVAILCQASCGTTDSVWCRGENSLSQAHWWAILFWLCFCIIFSPS